MKFNDFANLYEAISQDALQGILQQTLRPELVTKVMAILSAYQHSPLVKFIMGRASDPKNHPPQKFEIKKVGTLEACKLDPVVYELLLNVTDNGVGPGEVLIALIAGTWKGGNQGDYDVYLPDIGKVEIKYLNPFAHSTNVPLGSSEKKIVANTDFEKVIGEIGALIRSTPEILKGTLTPEEMDYFLRETLDQIYNNDRNLSTNSLRLIARILRNAEKSGRKDFSSKGITFARLAKAMEVAIHNAIGPAPYLMFIGDRTIAGKDMYAPSTVNKGQYYIMPKEDVRYYMISRMFKQERIKMAPFSTEKEFFDKTVKE